MPSASSIAALLGPTNTGKTHRAVERMLEHRTGMIGLPLRLLAREVYDRITPRVGERAVALITGEEKRIPARPRYWVCTVESMPVDREVEFLAVDEVQLCSHPQRGHVFTDRLLHARGTAETWFLGADTMHELVEVLVPTAHIRRHPRLSTLSAVEPSSLRSLPKRSAVIAFSAREVYELAERLRERRGGAAVVMGALSPRTRNAQVAMYQSGEVDFLVATDAVGMGLNMDVDHVAFAALRKFDGFEHRELTPGELAQIAGRAGRYTRNGTFGTIQPLKLPVELMRAVESHRFAPVRRVMWRNSDLDHTSVAGLAESLDRRSPRRELVPVDGASDREALDLMVDKDEVKVRAKGEPAVRLLWDVCRVPDFRRLMVEHHVTLLSELFVQLCDDGRIRPDFMHQRISRLEQDRGDIDTLMMRMESIRTWNYVAHHADWVDDAQSWQQRTARAEDRLSEALHQRLIERFVERQGRKRRGGHKTRKSRTAAPRASAPAPTDASSPFAALAGLREQLRGEEEPVEVDDLVEDTVAASHDQLQGDVSGWVWLERRDHCLRIGRLTGGAELLHPDVKIHTDAPVSAGGQQRMLRRLRAWLRDVVEELRAALPEPASAGTRGLRYLLEQRLGSVSRPGAIDPLSALDEADRKALGALTFGRRHIYAAALLEPDAMRRRWMLYAAKYGRPLSRRGFGRPCFAIEGKVEDAELEAGGYGRVGRHAVRVDVLERIVRRVEKAARDAAGGPFAMPDVLPEWLELDADDAEGVVIALGFPREAEGFIVERRSRRSRRGRRRRSRRGRASAPTSSSESDESENP